MAYLNLHLDDSSSNERVRREIRSAEGNDTGGNKKE
jgi:hypothetical protein